MRGAAKATAVASGIAICAKPAMNKTEDPPMAKPRPICNPMPAVAKGRAPARSMKGRSSIRLAPYRPQVISTGEYSATSIFEIASNPLNTTSDMRTRPMAANGRSSASCGAKAAGSSFAL